MEKPGMFSKEEFSQHLFLLLAAIVTAVIVSLTCYIGHTGSFFSVTLINILAIYCLLALLTKIGRKINQQKKDNEQS